MTARRKQAPAEPGNESGGPVRKCFVTGDKLPQKRLIRFVVGPGNTVVPDLEGKLPGRGFWLSTDPDVINTACNRRLFNRAACQNVEVSPTLTADIEALLTRRCLDLISLARRAGQAVAGFEKVSIWLKKSLARPGVLLVARDGALDGKDKVRRLAGDTPVVDCLEASELGRAMGSERTVHLVVHAGGLAERILKDTGRLEKFRRRQGA